MLGLQAVESHLYVVGPFPASEVGYRFHAWNRPLDDDQAATLSSSCGAPRTYYPNAVVLDLPHPSPDTASLCDPKVLRELLLMGTEAVASILTVHEHGALEAIPLDQPVG